MAARKTTKAKKAGKARAKTSVLRAITEITGLSREDVREELMLLVRPSRKTSAKKTRKSS